eukprot:gene16412-21751_t
MTRPVGNRLIEQRQSVAGRAFGSAGKSSNTYRGLVSAHPKAIGSRNFTQCDSLLIGKDCAAHTVPYIEARNGQSVFEHEATTTRLSDDQLFYCQQRGLDTTNFQSNKEPMICFKCKQSGHY